MSTANIDDTNLFVRQDFDTAALVAQHPPRFTHPHKQLVYTLATAGSPPRGTLHFSRWRPAPLPEVGPAQTPEFVVRADVFAYESPATGTVEWTLNFADPHIFFAYAGRLLAQDELQVLEHPALGSLCEALQESRDPRLQALTVQDGMNTPALVRGVERRCALATDPDLLEGRPLGLYGNRFAVAKEDALRRALRIIEPPTVSNILAMAAPAGGSGRYSEQELRDILVTAHTGFRAAMAEAAVVMAAPRVVINTGHWGTGAFGGNRVVMAVLQAVAARLAGIHRLVYHTVDTAGTDPCYEAQRLLRELLPAGSSFSVEAVLRQLYGRDFRWGVSDGN